MEISPFYLEVLLFYLEVLPCLFFPTVLNYPLWVQIFQYLPNYQLGPKYQLLLIIADTGFWSPMFWWIPATRGIARVANSNYCRRCVLQRMFWCWGVGDTPPPVGLILPVLCFVDNVLVGSHFEGRLTLPADTPQPLGLILPVSLPTHPLSNLDCPQSFSVENI